MEKNYLKKFIKQLKKVYAQGFYKLYSKIIKKAKLNYLEKQKNARRLSTAEVKSKAQQTGKKNVGCRNSVIKVYERNSYVVEFAKRRANGYCELFK